MLRELVTRDGLTYRARGYGSRRPIAKNDRESGRRLNRRVTVSFDRPAAEPGPSASASASETVGTAAPRPATTSTELPVVATARAGTPPDIERTQWPRQAEVDINELRRDAGGNVLLTWTVRNQDETPLNVWSSHDYGSVYEEASTSAITLVSGEQRYRVLRDVETRVAIGPDLIRTGLDEYTVEKGERYTLWAMFKPPADLARVTVRIPGFEPVPDVPIS